MPDDDGVVERTRREISMILDFAKFSCEYDETDVKIYLGNRKGGVAFEFGEFFSDMVSI